MDGKDLALLCALLLLGATAVAWFRGDYSAVAGYDFATSLKPYDDLTRSMYLWDERLYAGAPNVLSTATMPYFLLQYLFEELAGSLYGAQMFFFAVIFVLPGVTMFYLLSVIFRDEDERRLMVFFGALFYMLNTFVVVKWNRGELVTLFSYGMIPLFLALIERGLQTRIDLRYAFLFIAAMFFFPVSLGHTADFLITVSLTGAFAAWRVFCVKGELNKRLKKAAVLLIAAVLLSAWWLLPLLGGFTGGGAAKTASFVANDMGIVNYYSSWATILNLMKMWFFAMYSTAVEFNAQYYRPGTLIFPIIAFTALLFRRNGYVLFFSIAALAGIWLAKGTSKPFPWIFKWMYLHLPLFFVFRAPSRYFPLIYTLSLAVLTAYSVAKLSTYLRKNLAGSGLLRTAASKGTFAGFALLIFLHSWPLFDRDVLFRTVKNDILLPGIFVNIPEYYDKSNGWLKSRPGYGRVHSFNNQTYLNYTWGYSSTDIASRLIEMPQTLKFSQELQFGSHGFHDLMEVFDREFWRWDFDAVDKVLGLLSARYIFVTDDVMRRYQPDPGGFEILTEVLSHTPNVTLAASFGKARIYENASALPHVYAAPFAKDVYGGTEGLAALAQGGYLEKPALRFFNPDEDPERGFSGDFADELILADKNLWDILYETLYSHYKLTDFSRNIFTVDAPDSYALIARADFNRDERPARVDGAQGASAYAEKELHDGIRWKTLGVWKLSGGMHRLDTAQAYREIMVIPLDVLSAEAGRAAKFFYGGHRRITHVVRAAANKGEVLVPFSIPAEGFDVSVERVPAWSRTRKTALSEDYTEGVSGSENRWALLDDGAETGTGGGAVFYTRKAQDGFRVMRKIRKKNPSLLTFDPEEYPMTDLVADVEPKGLYDVDVSVGIDTSGTGWADGEVPALTMTAGGEKIIHSLSDGLKEKFGFPGRLRYSPVWVGIKVKKARGAAPGPGVMPKLTIKSLSFYREVPVYEDASHWKNGPVELCLDGKCRAESAFPSYLDGVSTDGGYHELVIKGPIGAHYLVTIKNKGRGAPAGVSVRGEDTSEPPKLSAGKIDPTRYVVTVTPVNGGQVRPFWLVFNEGYSPGWTARSGGAVLKEHVMMNGYANGWRIDKIPPGRQFEITLDYAPQRFLDAGIKVSGVFTAVFLVAAAVYARARGTGK